MKINIKKFVLFLGVFLSISFFYMNISLNAEESGIKVVMAGVDHYPVLEGDKKIFYISSFASQKVQYRIFLLDSLLNEYKELTDGFTEFMDPTEPYIIQMDDVFSAGNYKLKIWIRKENSSKEYDHEYISNLKVENQEQNVLVHTEDNMKIEKEIYTVGEEINVQGIENMEAKEDFYKYKLHIYDVLNNKWIVDEKEYRDNITWVPEHPGEYILDLWMISGDSENWSLLDKNPDAKVYDAWKIKQISVEPKPEIRFVALDHYPMVEGENQKIYITAKNAEKVQYRAWLIKDENIIDITNGYTHLIDADKPYEVDFPNNLKEGTYKLWILVRKEGSLSRYDNKYESLINYLPSNNGEDIIQENKQNNISFEGDLDIEKDTYSVGETVFIYGINGINTEENTYKYKLHILNIETGEWIIDDNKYRDVLMWTPTETGNYMLDVWTISTESDKWEEIQLNPQKRLYDGWKLKPITILAKDDTDKGEVDSGNIDNKENQQTDNQNDLNIEQNNEVNDEDKNESKNDKEYTTIVNDIKELYIGIEKGYNLIINDKESKELYKKANEIISEIILPDMSDLEKEIAIHDYIIINTKYDYDNYLSGTVDKDAYNAYGALVNGVAVCQGYADSFKMLLNMVGIECQLIIGRTFEEHAWGLVKIDGNYYHVDTTWDNSVYDEDSVSYAYFNLSDEEMSREHSWDKEKYPAAVSNKFEYMRYMRFPVLDDGWIYYSDDLDGRKLYKVRADGSDKVKLTNASSVYIDTDEEWVYYSNYSHGGYLFKVKKDGIGNIMLNEEWSKEIEVKDKWIYYFNNEEKLTYKIKKNGTDKQIVDS